MCYGWLIYQEKRVVAHGQGGFVNGRTASSNGAEYLGLIEGLEALLDMGLRDEPVLIMGDAKTIIEQMQGMAEVKSIRVKPLHKRASRLTRQFSGLLWQWSPRRENRAADILSRRALQQIHMNLEAYQGAVEAIERQKSSQKTADHFLTVLDLRVFQGAKVSG
jgi:ribonuclease HI